MAEDSAFACLPQGRGARDDESWPAFDASPQVERRIAQKNLVVFDVDLATPAPSPNITWKYFTVGGPLAALLRILRGSDRELGVNTLFVRSDFARQAARATLLCLARLSRNGSGRTVCEGSRSMSGIPARGCGSRSKTMSCSGHRQGRRHPHSLSRRHRAPMAIGVESTRHG